MKTSLCRKHGCSRTAVPGKNFCSKHESMEAEYLRRKKQVFTKRGKSSQWHHLYNTPRWRTMSKAFLTKYKYCFICGKPSEIADHIVPHRGNLSLFYDENNLQPMCWSCHSRKTFAENKNFRKGDGGSKS